LFSFRVQAIADEAAVRDLVGVQLLPHHRLHRVAPKPDNPVHDGPLSAQRNCAHLIGESAPLSAGVHFDHIRFGALDEGDDFVAFGFSLDSPMNCLFVGVLE